MYAQAARALAEALVRRGITAVYGGAKIGLMGVLADTMLSRGGKVVGVIPDFLRHEEVVHTGLTELHVVPSLFERKRLLMELSEAFVALPGGLGTLDEISEVLTWGQLGLHRKPFGFLNVAGFFDDLLRYFRGLEREHFMLPEHGRLFVVDSEPAALLEVLETYSPSSGLVLAPK